MKKIIVLNHKSYLKFEEIKSYPIEINDYIRSDQTVIICPSSIYMPYFKGKYNFKLGSQTIDNKNETGSLTGQILKSINVDYALIDTKNMKDESALINGKIKESIDNNIKPIVIIGESFYEKELNKTASVINRQIRDYFKNIDVKQDIIICYVPNWSYQGKQIPTENYISEVIELIKNIMKRSFNANTKVIYGGNITKDNIKEIDHIKSIDGYLIEKPGTNISELKQILDIIE